MQNLKPEEQKTQSPKETYFEPESGYMLVRLHKQAYGLPDVPVTYQGRTFQTKDELHTTIHSHQAAEARKQHHEQHPEDQEQVRKLAVFTANSCHALYPGYG